MSWCAVAALVGFSRWRRRAGRQPSYPPRVSDESPLAVAQSLLEQLQRAVETHELGVVLDLLTADAVVLGTAAENLERPEIEAYLGAVVAEQATITWHYDTVRVVDARPDAVTFVALGSVGWDDDEDERDPFRLTCLAVRDAGRWRLRLFHGSVPQA